MPLIAKILIALLALLHVFFAYIEIFAWEKMGKRVVPGMEPEIFAKTVGMAANQGLYNLFLVAGLIWALLASDPALQRKLALFFLACIAVAGVYGYLTVAPRAIFVQTVPAVLALAALLIPRSA